MQTITRERRLALMIFSRAFGGATLALVLSFSASADFTGKVVAVADGDTLTVQINSRQVKIHLAEIDAPELRQPFGKEARQSLTDLCFGKDADVREERYDRYGRVMGRVECSGTDASAEQVRRGMAWVYQRNKKSTSPLYLLEDAAQRSHEGLWTDKSPVRPWIWRRDQRRHFR